LSPVFTAFFIGNQIMKKSVAVFLTILLGTLTMSGQKGVGSIIGTIIEKSSGTPLEFANVVLKNKNDSTQVQGTMTNNKGEFFFDKLKNGEYKIIYSFIGFEKIEIPVIQIDEKHSKVNLGKLYISGSSQSLGEVEVTAQRSTFVNSIDRKTFNVGSDLMSKTGSVSDLLQNVPSVQVDIDGNVSLRGSGNVTILVNGKPSAMMNLNPAAILQQMQASSIDKIEIITNPSAKYKPDGTSGIINIVTKKDSRLGFNGNVSANVGNDERYNGNIMLNYNPGRINLFGSIAIRQDDRRRINDVYTQQYSDGVQVSQLTTHNKGYARPISDLANLGADYNINDRNKISASVSYNYRYQIQNDVSIYIKDSLGVINEIYNRDRYLPEMESDFEITSAFQHKFSKAGHELSLNYTNSFAKENEDNYYTNTFAFPESKYYYDNMFYLHTNNVSQLLIEYSNPLSKNSKLEAGYELEIADNDMDLHRDTTAINQSDYYTDFSRSNRFIRSEFTNVLYLTYEGQLGKFGFLAGLRAEHTSTEANLVSRSSIINIQYSRLYPSLHTTYKISETNELQLNYSHRINRPEDEQLNPFPEYQDLMNVRVGNPYLKPEDIHSMEIGYQLKKKATTFISTLYYRYNYNGITSILTNSTDTVISTLQNLALNQSAGLELILNTNLGKFASFNISSNTFYNTINASDLGFGQSKSDISFSISGSLGLNLTKSTVLQITSNYKGERLTPQGKRLPSFVVNTGFKQDFLKKKASLIITVSDLFNTLRNNYLIDTPDLKRQEYRRRSSHFVYIGFTYNFGNSGKKQNENSLKYDNQL
jgi:outer membrane receptor protein involved in Fe transport